MPAKSQLTKKVLFIGNSYTAVNDLPSIISLMAENTGDVLVSDSNTPGGYRFMNHATNATTLNKINSNSWDYVVLQGQSQETSFSASQLLTEVYPYATTLSNAIRQNNACSQPLFYMTWGRKNGDSDNCPFIPWVCTYEGMDDAIRTSYLNMAQNNHAQLAPVGALWRHLRVNNPSIELYSSDESHPSMEGSYAAACALYTLIYKKNPTLITWNSSLSPSVATTIKLAAKTIVFDQLALWDFTINTANANYSETIQAAQVSFTNTSTSFDSLLWDFGDGTSSTEINPIHTFPFSGMFAVSQTAIKCGKSAVLTKTLQIETGLNTGNWNSKSDILIFPNPTENLFEVNLNRNFKKTTAEIFDSSGSILFSKEIRDSASFQMDVSPLSSGIYLLRITADQNVFFSKISKK